MWNTYNFIVYIFPLFILQITSWEKRLYQLKDKRLQAAAKGHLIITFGIMYNPIRASVRTFNPKEDKILAESPRFRRQGMLTSEKLW